MSYVKSLRMVTCGLCNRKVTETTATRGSIGNTQVWFCKPCAKDPEKGAKR